MSKSSTCKKVHVLRGYFGKYTTKTILLINNMFTKLTMFLFTTGSVIQDKSVSFFDKAKKLFSPH